MKLAKIASVIMLVLMALSIVPVVAAHEGSSETTGDEVKEIAQKRFDENRDALKHRAEQQREALNSKREEMREKIDARKASIKTRIEEIRATHKFSRELAKQFKEAREALKEEGKQKKGAIAELRATLRDCAGKATDECEQARTQARTHATNYLSNRAKLILAYLERLRERVEASGNAGLIAEIEALQSETSAAQETIDSLGAEATKEDLKESAEALMDTWSKAKNIGKQGVSLVASKRFGGVLEKIEHLKTKFDRTIARLEAAGKDTSGAKAAQAEFNAHLEAAQKLHDEMTALIASGDHSGAAEKLHAAHAELKAAHESMKAVIQNIRAVSGSKELEEESEDADESGDDSADENGESADEGDGSGESGSEDSGDSGSDGSEGSEDEGSESNADESAGTG